MKIQLRGLKNSFELEEQRINEFKGRSIEMIKSEEQKEERWRKINRAYSDPQNTNL